MEDWELEHNFSGIRQDLQTLTHQSAALGEIQNAIRSMVKQSQALEGIRNEIQLIHQQLSSLPSEVGAGIGHLVAQLPSNALTYLFLGLILWRVW